MDNATKLIEYENHFFYFYSILIDICRENVKEVLKERFDELKKQIEDIRSIYCKNDRKERISDTLACKIVEDDKVIVSELPKNEESTDSDEDSSGDKTVKSDESKIDVLTSLRRTLENLEKQFSNEDQTKRISEKIFVQYGHLLIRTLEKIKMYFTDYDKPTKQFPENVKNVLIKRLKQLQRLCRTSVLEDYDHRMLEYETTLQQRISVFKSSETRKQSFAQLKAKCSDVFDLYIRQCVRFHSTLSVKGIYGNFDEFVEHFFGQQIDVTENERKALELSFANFDIPLDNPEIVCRRRLHTRQSQSEYIFPSQHINDPIKEEEIDVGFIDLIKSIRNNRWIVLLGSAGSGKTTFARWLTCQFAQTLFIEEQNVIIHGINMGPVRIPILIRIGEFTQWLENHSTSNLLDYIGEQTWLGQEYVNGRFEILKDFVLNGHALIILDGLDEIATLELHNRVVGLVRDFMQSYCMSHEFVTPFDDAFMANTELNSDFQREGLSGKNLLIVTSRIVNYSTHPLNGELIIHYIIQPMNTEYLNNFVTNWCLHVQDEIIHLFIRNLPDFKKKKIKFQSNVQAKILLAKIAMNEGLRSLVSNPSVLSIVCTLFARHGVETLEKTRVQLYEKVVELMLQRWQYHKSNICRDALISIFSNMAFYIHSHSGSGLIDEFDLNHLCRLSLRRWYNKTNVMGHDLSKIPQQAEQFMQLLSEDAGIVAARALGIYGFLHLSFQEYFVCRALVHLDDSSVKINTKQLITRFISLFPNPRLRESLNLVLGWISLYWSSQNYDEFCTELQCKTNVANKHIPLGSLWFVSAINDLAHLPSPTIVYNILNALLDVHIYEKRENRDFERELRMAFDRLPIALVNDWFGQLFLKEDQTITLEMLHMFSSVIHASQTLPQWITTVTCELLWKQLGLFNEEVDVYLDRILMIIGARDCDRLPKPTGSMREYLLSRSISTAEIHSSIFTAIIALYGGLELTHFKTKRQISITFAARRIHRDSPLTPLFIEYLDDTITERTIKLKRLIDQCEKIVAKASTTNITLQSIHSLVVLFCFYSINQSSNYEQYIGSKLWQQAIRHMKVVLLYLREFFCINPYSKFKDNLTKIFQYFAVDSKEDNLDFTQSISHVYCELLRAKTSSIVSRYSKGSFNPLVVIKMPPSIKLPTMTDWNEDQIVRLLPFICCVALSSSHDIAIEELELEDLNLLKRGKHPFQILQDKPITLLLGFVPSSVQSLYMQLLTQNEISFDDTSTLPFLHLLTEFLCVVLTMNKHSIRFWLLLSVLLPTFTQHKMENFISRFVDLWIAELNHKHFFKAYKDNGFHSIASEIRIGDYTEEKHGNELAMIEEQHRITHAQTDLELYAASCCLSKLTKSLSENNEPEVLQTQFNELWNTVQVIKQPVWRLDATINICCIFFPKREYDKINDQLKTRYLTLITWLKELEPITSLLTYVALFVRCLNFFHKDFQLEKSLIYNILERLKTVTIEEQQAICEALISFPALRIDISQYIFQTQHLENAVKLNQIFQRTSTVFSKHLSAKFFSASDIRGVSSTLLSSMHLCELNSYLKFLDDSSIKETRNHSINNLPSQSLGEKCLKALAEEPIQLLTTEAASMIRTFISSPIEETENIQMLRIEQSLMKKTSIDDSAYSFVLEWISYRYDERLCSFAYQGALLLGLSNMWTSTIIEICCELLSSENNHLQDTATQLIGRKEWCSEKQSNNIIINYINQWNKKKSKYISEIEVFFDTLGIQTVDEIEQILQLEHDRFEKTTENKLNTMNSEVSFFRLIDNLSSQVKDYLTDTIQSLSTCLPDTTDLLIGICFGSFPVGVKVTAARKLYFVREEEQVQNVLWNIVINNEIGNSDELVAACIWSLFINRKNDQFMQKRLKKLDHLRQHTRSSLIRQAALSAMYCHMITESEKYHLLDVYYAHMTNADFYRTSLSGDGGYDRTTDWIIKHASILLPQFIDDMYKSFDDTSNFYVPNYIKVAKRICKEIPKQFRVTVRQSSIGENAFRKGLYEMSKKITKANQIDYLYVYASFEQVSLEYVIIYLRVGRTKTMHAYFSEHFRFVSERQAIELLADALRSSSSVRRRCAAAELLVKLTVLGQVSAIEVQNLLSGAIDDLQSQQFIDSKLRTDRTDSELKRLLLQLMAKEPDSMRCGGTIDMINQTLEDRIPAAVFHKTN
jgi:hypothetical protein